MLDTRPMLNNTDIDFVLLDFRPVPDDDWDEEIDITSSARNRADERELNMSTWLTRMEPKWPAKVVSPFVN